AGSTPAGPARTIGSSRETAGASHISRVRFVDGIGRLHQDEIGAVARPRLVCAKRGTARDNDARGAYLSAVALIADVRPGDGPRQSGLCANAIGHQASPARV